MIVFAFTKRKRKQFNSECLEYFYNLQNKDQIGIFVGKFTPKNKMILGIISEVRALPLGYFSPRRGLPWVLKYGGVQTKG